MASVMQRFVAEKEVTYFQLEGPIGNHLIHNTADRLRFQAGRPRTDFMTRRAIAAPLVLQEWESGAVMLKKLTQVETVLQRADDLGSCGWEEMCFCGSFTCKLPSEWVSNKPLQLGTERRLDVAVPQWRVPSNMRATVDVIFGIEVHAESPLLGEIDLESSWNFNDRHEVRQPWAQRNMYSFCTQFPQELRVTSKRCWIEDFRRYVMQRGLRFPLPRHQFDNEVMTFSVSQLTGLSASKDFLWIRGSEVKASFMSFNIDVRKYAPTEFALEHQKKWDDYLNRYNADASRFARDAWHTASLWVRAEAQNELIMSTVLTLLIVILLAFLGMVVFTKNAALSMFVVLATVGVVGNLFFFIVVLMGWAVGPIEVIALIVFIGYAVTYSLHIAHRYGSGEAVHCELPEDLSATLSEADALRYKRSLFALQTIGSAALGSAVTTIGSSLFLMFCTLTIFKKLGGVVLAVTLLSIIMALAPLPATLLMVGPTSPGKRCLPRPADFFDGLAGMKDGFVSMLSWRPGFFGGSEEEEEQPPDGGAAPPAARSSASGDAGGGGGREHGGGALASPGGSVIAPMGTLVGNMPPAAHPNAGTSGAAGAASSAGNAPPGPRSSNAPLGGNRPAGHAPSQGAFPAGATVANDRRRRLSEMDFDIGTESPLECIWAHEARGAPSSGDARRTRPPAATL